MITKQIAGILYGNSYRLYEVGTGAEYNIIQINDDIDITLGIQWSENKIIKETIFLNQIGTDFLIIARPLSDLTKEIEGVGVPLVELAKIAFPDEFWKLIDGKSIAVSDKKKVFSGITKNDDDEYFISFNTWLVNSSAGGFISTENQLNLFQKLQELHFAVNLPEGTWIDINQIEK